MGARPVSGSSVRATAQPLVRIAAEHGASVDEITKTLRSEFGRAYRRADLLVDIRSYRDAARTTAIAGYRDMRSLIARAGVAAFSVSLLLPSIVHGATSADRVFVASSIEDVRAVVEVIAIPNARVFARAAAPIAVTDPTPEPTPAPTLAPMPAPPPPLVYAAMPNGQSGVVVTASWYGTGFYENRLPCWQWLQANGLPIQLLPDTWGVANRTLPCGTMLTLSHGANVVTVPVVDRGPYVAGRELDLAPPVKAALGCTDLCTLVMHIP